MIWNMCLRAGAACFLLAQAASVVQAEPNERLVPADIAKAVNARLAEIETAARGLDPDKVFRYVLENDQGALVQDGKLYVTRDAALQSTKQGFRNLKTVDYRFDRQFLTLLAPTVVLSTGEGLSTATTDDGRTISTRFAQTVVLVLTDGEWKVLHAHRSFPRVR